MATGACGELRRQNNTGATLTFSVDDIGANPGNIEIIDLVLTDEKAEIENPC